MIFNSLSSEVIKAGLASKLAFSLGFKMISTTIKAKKVQDMALKQRQATNFETGTLDDSPLEEAEIAKRRWCSFSDWANTEGYNFSTIEEIAEAYVKSSGKPQVKASPEIIALRASISGQSVETLQKVADKQAEVTVAKVAYLIQNIMSELSDIKHYANGFYNNDKINQEGTLVHSSVDIEEIITKEWVEENYPLVMKSQINYWTRFNNWDDAELVMIQADKLELGI